MEWVIAVLMLIVGIAIGFVLGKQQGDKTSKQTHANHSEQATKEVVAQLTSEHVLQSRKMAQSLQAQAEELSANIEHFATQMSSADKISGDENFSFFSQDTSAMLRTTQQNEKRLPSNADTQPKDFSNESTGLFDGSKNRHLVDQD